MSFPRSLAVALVGLGMTAGCASRQTQAARAAWKQAVRGDDTTPARGDGSGDDRKTGDTADPNTWRDLTNFTNDTADLLSLGVSTAPLATLVARLCAEPPEASPGVLAPDAVRCPPKPTMEPIGHTLTLEVGRHGTVGLVATELSSKDSLDLLKLARENLAGSCAGDWTKITEDLLYTCAAPSGSTVVLARFLSAGGGERWQFSLAVLGPG
jgi:hypothetical protein